MATLKFYENGYPYSTCTHDCHIYKNGQWIRIPTSSVKAYNENASSFEDITCGGLYTGVSRIWKDTNGDLLVTEGVNRRNGNSVGTTMYVANPSKSDIYLSIVSDQYEAQGVPSPVDLAWVPSISRWVITSGSVDITVGGTVGFYLSDKVTPDKVKQFSDHSTNSYSSSVYYDASQDLLYFSRTRKDQVLIISPADAYSGSTIDVSLGIVLPLSGGVYAPTAQRVTRIPTSGDIWVPSNGNSSAIKIYDSSGTFITDVGVIAANSAYGGSFYDSTTNRVYVCSRHFSRVEVYDVTSRALVNMYTVPSMNNPISVWVDSTYIYAADFSSTGGIPEFFRITL